MTTSESKGRFLLNKSIRIDSHNESIRIANWNALYRTAYGKAYGRAPDLRSRGRGFGVSDDSQWGAAANDCRQVVYTHEPEPLSPSIIIWYGRRGSYTVPACVLFLLHCLKTVDWHAITPPATAQILSPWVVTSRSLYPLPSKFVYVATAATHSESYPSRDVLWSLYTSESASSLTVVVLRCGQGTGMWWEENGLTRKLTPVSLISIRWRTVVDAIKFSTRVVVYLLTIKFWIISYIFYVPSHDVILTLVMI